MTLEEYKNLLLNNGIIECDTECEHSYVFTQKGINFIKEKFPEYPAGWIGALRDNAFWGVEPGQTDPYAWNWYYENENPKAMEYVIEIFNLSDIDYIDLDDIVL